MVSCRPLNSRHEKEKQRCSPRGQLGSRHAPSHARRVRHPGRRGLGRRPPGLEPRGRPAPEAVAIPADVADVAGNRPLRRENGLRVATQGTGHNAGAYGRSGGAILVRTTALDGLEIDGRQATRPRRRRDALGRGAPSTSDARPGADGGLLDRRRRGRLHARRRPLLARPRTGSRPVTSRRSSWSPPTASTCAPTPTTSRTCSGPCAGAAAASVRSPRSSSGCTRCPSSTRACWRSPGSAPPRCSRRGGPGCPEPPEEVTSVGRIMQFPPFPEVPEIGPRAQARDRRGRLLGRRGGGRRPARAAARARPRDRHLRRRAAGRALPPAHGSRTAVPGMGDHRMLGELSGGGDRGDGRGRRPRVRLAPALGGAAPARRRPRAPDPAAGALAALRGEFALFAVGIAADPSWPPPQGATSRS